MTYNQQDVPALIRYPTRSSAVLPSHHLSTYRLAALFTIPLVLSLILFWTFTRGQTSLVLVWEILPQSYLLLLVLFFVLPLQRLSRTGRYRFLSTLKRVSIGGIAEAQDGKFGDILLADVLTSYAKVLGDLFVAFCMFVSPSRSSTDRPDRGCGGQYVVPLIISIPSLIRLRQCLIEFVRVRKTNQKRGGVGSSGWGGQHLANALKYASAFPVVILSALQRGYDPSKIGMSEAGLFRLWYTTPALPAMDLAYCVYLGSSLSSSTPSTLFTGTSLRTGTSASSPAHKNATIRSTNGVYGDTLISMRKKCIMGPSSSILCYGVPGVLNYLLIWITSTTLKVAYSLWSC